MSTPRPDVDIVLRTSLAIIPPEGQDTDYREVSACLIVPSTHETFACVTDTRCLAVVKVEGEAQQEQTVDLSMVNHVGVKLPTVVRRTAGWTEVFRGVQIDGKWKPIGRRFRSSDESKASKFPRTGGILNPISETDADKYQMVFVDADLLCKLSESLTEAGDVPMVHLLIPKDGDVTEILVVNGSDIGVVKCCDTYGQPGKEEIIKRFNNTANAFNAARAEAKRKGGAS